MPPADAPDLEPEHPEPAVPPQGGQADAVEGSGPPAAPPGLDLARLQAWFDAELPGLRAGNLHGTVIAGGRSNLTYRLADDRSVWALRRPPLGHVLPTAHDMAREFRVIGGLRHSDVPVPVPVALCEDPSVLGCPFYLMDFVDGVVLSRPDTVPAGARRRVGELLVDTLVALHAVDPATVGLGGLGRPDGFRARQVERWHRQFEASWEGGHPAEAEVVRRLRGGVPQEGPSGIVHGDYRLTNLMYRPDLAAVAAVVDWEMATLGDPLTDVALLHAYHSLASRAPGLLADFGPDQGYLGPDELVDRYCTATGTPREALDWYLGFAYFKISAIAAGIHARHRAGLTVGEGFGVFGSVVDLALDAAGSHLPT